MPGVAYYDTPFVLDELMGDIISGHRTSISQMVLSSKNSGIVSEAISDRRLEDFGKCISRVLPGEIFYNENREFLGYCNIVRTQRRRHDRCRCSNYTRGGKRTHTRLYHYRIKRGKQDNCKVGSAWYDQRQQISQDRCIV